MEVVTIPAIVIFVYAITEIIKRLAFQNSEKFKKIIPIFAGILGIISGIIVFFAFPEIMPAENWYSAIIIGFASGLSAVGINQIPKQIIKFRSNVNSDKNTGG